MRKNYNVLLKKCEVLPKDSELLRFGIDLNPKIRFGFSPSLKEGGESVGVDRSKINFIFRKSLPFCAAH